MTTDKLLPSYFGRYQVLEELGSGAMGVVYLCVDPRLARPVAVKVLKESEFMTPAEREQYEARFRNEAEAAGRLNHPDIVQIYDIGPSYLVMEFLEGRPLSAVVKAGGEMAVRDITALVLRVADAIDYAHRNGIVHRDIKPANIMILDDASVKVMDFGVARLESSTLTAVGTVLGSVRYMAPEQMMGEPIDGRADIFSLATVAYELLTDHAPFPGKSITEVVARVVHGSHVPPREVDARLPEALNGVFARAFAPVVSRYGRAVEFARDLQESSRAIQELAVVHRGESGDRAPTVREKAPASPPVETVLLEATRRPKEGVLILESDPPGARVHVDGTPAGQTPIPGLDVAFGRHVVRMEAPGRDSVSAEVELRRDLALRVLTLTLPLPRSGEEVVRRGQFVSFSPDVTPPRRTSGALPVYPEAARERGLEGSPSAEVWVSESGDVVDVSLVESAGVLLDGALLEAVTGWKFSPATLRGVPVSVKIRVQHLFRA